VEPDISILRKTGHFYFALTRRETRCRCKMRMSGLSKVEMSAFIGGRGPHGNGANRFETRRETARDLSHRGQGCILRSFPSSAHHQDFETQVDMD
jgi:hypothetical protein